MGQAPDHLTSQVTINRVSAFGSGLCSPARWGSARSLSRVSSGGPTTWLVVCLQLGRTNGLRETHLALELQSHCYSFWGRRRPRMMSLKYLFYGSNCPYLCHSWFQKWPQGTVPRHHNCPLPSRLWPPICHQVLLVLFPSWPHAA